MTTIMSQDQIEQFKNMTNILKDIELSKSYTCGVCGEVVKPKIYFESGEIYIDVDKSSIRGGIGNKILQDNICDECAKKMLIKS